MGGIRVTIYMVPLFETRWGSLYTAGHSRVASLALTGNSPSGVIPPYTIHSTKHFIKHHVFITVFVGRGALTPPFPQ